MAISKTSALNLTPEEKQQLRGLEVLIDQLLTKKYHPGADYCTIDPFDLNLPTDSFPPRMKNALADLYSKAGWKVEFKTDQRDGWWIQFS